jgi:hypothetical protein
MSQSGRGFLKIVAVNSCCDLATLGETPGVSDIVKMEKNVFLNLRGTIG